LNPKKAQVLYLLQVLIVPNVETIWHFGGCYKQDLLMKLRPNFIGAPNVATLGEIMLERDIFFQLDLLDKFINYYNKFQDSLFSKAADIE
jgi:hypothetical protein